MARTGRVPLEASRSSARGTARGPQRLDRSARSWMFEVACALALILGITGALRLAWLCDDAYISFRYADNLVHGLGLVYNGGERVEGYSNFLWTMGIALGMRLGVGPEAWTVAWGVVFFAATIALLCAHGVLAGKGRGRVALGLPLAGLLAAVHRDWYVYATSGLETSCFTFLVTLAYVLAVAPAAPAWSAGLALALAALTRPDGIVFVPFFMLYMVLARPRRMRSGLECAGAFLTLWLLYVARKIHYYGDFFPNTYYAKSASLAWWSQGWLYVRLYFEKYWVLALAIPLVIAAWIPPRGAGDARAVPAAARRGRALRWALPRGVLGARAGEPARDRGLDPDARGGERTRRPGGRSAVRRRPGPDGRNGTVLQGDRVRRGPGHRFHALRDARGRGFHVCADADPRDAVLPPRARLGGRTTPRWKTSPRTRIGSVPHGSARPHT